LFIVSGFLLQPLLVLGEEIERVAGVEGRRRWRFLA
jgi:hypothetical protein